MTCPADAGGTGNGSRPYWMPQLVVLGALAQLGLVHVKMELVGSIWLPANQCQP